MPDYILLDDMIDDMIDNISYIKLNSYLNLDKDNVNNLGKCLKKIKH